MHEKDANILIKTLFFIAVLVLVSNSTVFAAAFWGRFTDPQDGKFDVSGWSEEEDEKAGGILPIPIIISEPALGGFGLGISLAYMQNKEPDEAEESVEPLAEEVRKKPPSVTGVAAAYTLNDSWFVAGGYSNNWMNDSLRYLGALGYAAFNLDFYGVGEDGLPSDTSIPFNIDGIVLFQDLAYRLFNSDIFLGAQYSIVSTEVTIDLSETIPGISPAQLDSSDGGAGPTLLYDSRDNTFTPNRGNKAGVSAIFHSPSIGGDFTYEMYAASWLTWFQVHPKVNLALRFEGDLAEGDTPFYALPFISLRGIPALRYQDEVVIVGEVEARYQASTRWSFIGFTGAGRVADTIGELGSATSRHTIGTGFRYYIARKFGLHSGVDVAWGPEKAYVYITVGSAW